MVGIRLAGDVRVLVLCLLTIMLCRVLHWSRQTNTHTCIKTHNRIYANFACLLWCSDQLGSCDWNIWFICKRYYWPSHDWDIVLGWWYRIVVLEHVSFIFPLSKYRSPLRLCAYYEFNSVVKKGMMMCAYLVIDAWEMRCEHITSSIHCLPHYQTHPVLFQ